MAKKTPLGAIGKGRRGISTGGWLVRGAAAGAAGTTVLNTVTYLDMAVRGRGTSDTPEQTVEALADKAHVGIPGQGDTRDNRVAGLGPLTGIVAGVGVGVLAGLARAAGFRPNPVVGGLVATVGALVGANGPMAALGISDPRTWSTTDWAADVVPHLAYGFATHSTLAALDRA
ncbi:hypothetical protein SAMN05660199_04363 [Klenkia soli]|uniref:Uncharacterized protein n=1 Tax=Klenkia soli TaxID=1052260 RepID=A0A1H0U4Q2_9ACTN|nr:hypothetical protein [Klenkia soli]SDP60948.1 hypothetical protein SAMN05660199_04363 [Klenkia soli]